MQTTHDTGAMCDEDKDCCYPPRLEDDVGLVKQGPERGDSTHHRIAEKDDAQQANEGVRPAASARKGDAGTWG